MIDLTNAKILRNRYGGSEAKRTIQYNDKIYLVKFPDPIRSKKNNLRYMNNQFSEDIGCKILKEIGLNVQNTFLATFKENNGKDKIVVACEDFCIPDAQLIEFKKFAVSATGLDETFANSFELLEKVIKEEKIIDDTQDFTQRFWDMFVGDALIGNSDRHFENFGILETKEKVSFAPIYDCGSSLSALVSDEDMKNLIEDDANFSNEAYNVKTAYTYGGKRVFFHEIFKNPPLELAEAIERVVPNIHTFKISDIIHNTEGISDIRKLYLAKSVSMRYEKILKPAYKKLQKMKTSMKTTAQEQDYGYSR